MKRASVLECSSPLELWPKAILANQRVNGFSPRRGDWRTAHGSRNDTARADKPWWLGLADGDVCQSGGGPPHSEDAGAFALRLAIAKGHGPRPSRALRRDFARCRHPARAPQNERPFYEDSTALSNFPRPLRLDVSAPETGADRTRVSSASAGGVAKSSPGLSEAIPPRATLRQPSGLRFIASLSSLSFSCKIANFDINWVCL